MSAAAICSAGLGRCGLGVRREELGQRAVDVLARGLLGACLLCVCDGRDDVSEEVLLQEIFERDDQQLALTGRPGEPVRS